VDSCESQLRAREEGVNAARTSEGARLGKERTREAKKRGQRKNGGVAVGQHERNKSAMGGRKGVDSCEAASSEHESADDEGARLGKERSEERRRWLREGSDRERTVV